MWVPLGRPPHGITMICGWDKDLIFKRFFGSSQLPKMFRTCGAFAMSFAPQRRALLQQLNFQKRSEYEVFCAFWLRHVLRHNGAQLFISHLPRRLRTRGFSKATLGPSGATKQLEKHSVSRRFYLFVHLDLLSSLIFFLLPFSSLTLPTSAFPFVHIVGSWLLNFIRLCIL